MTVTITENQKQLACKFLLYISDNNFNAMLEMITPTWRLIGGPPNLPQGETGLKMLYDHLLNVQQQWTINEAVAEGNIVVVRATNTCKQESFFNVPGVGKWQTFTAMFMFYFIDGKIETIWRNADDLGRVFQLGGQVVSGILN